MKELGTLYKPHIRIKRCKASIPLPRYTCCAIHMLFFSFSLKIMVFEFFIKNFFFIPSGDIFRAADNVQLISFQTLTHVHLIFDLLYQGKFQALPRVSPLNSCYYWACKKIINFTKKAIWFCFVHMKCFSWMTIKKKQKLWNLIKNSIY